MTLGRQSTSSSKTLYLHSLHRIAWNSATKVTCVMTHHGVKPMTQHGVQELSSRDLLVLTYPSPNTNDFFTCRQTFTGNLHNWFLSQSQSCMSSSSYIQSDVLICHVVWILKGRLGSRRTSLSLWQRQWWSSIVSMRHAYTALNTNIGHLQLFSISQAHFCQNFLFIYLLNFLPSSLNGREHQGLCSVNRQLVVVKLSLNLCVEKSLTNDQLICG